MNLSHVYLIHILFVAPLLMYSGYCGKELSLKCKDDSYSVIFTLLLIVGIVVLLYHGYKFLQVKMFI
jgi:hypothetical protein